MSGNIDLILNELKSIKNDQKQQSELFSQLISIVKATNEKVASTKEEVNILSNEFKSEIRFVHKKLDEITNQVVSNSEQLYELFNTQKLILESHQRQDKILETLAVRSLEQETDIRDLKRIK
ncbi:hypothetical protein J9303_16565 [Bacillaceae bacterium Marseille-Q3522]|nr:hypothetical protein [Bacillaceae bacterium Marseille-Q3522]